MNRLPRTFFSITLLTIVFLLNVPLALGGSLGQARFSWDAVPDPVVIGYKVHWGTQSGIYDQSIDAGNVSEVVIGTFTQGVPYFSSITAYSSTGEESDFSVEISFIIPLAAATTTPIITTQPAASNIVYGQTLASAILIGGAASVPGSFAFTTATSTPAAGTTLQSVTFTPIDTANYQTLNFSLNVTVLPAAPVIITQPSASTINYGQSLGSSILSGGVASVPGSFAFTTRSPVPTSGSSLGRARFSWDAVVDARVSGYKVYWGTLSGIYNHSFDAGNVTEVIIPDLSEGLAYFSSVTAYSSTGEESNYSVELSFTVPTSDGPTAPPAGATSLSVTFTPTDTSNYQTLAFNINVPVLQATPVITTQPTATTITYGQPLASSTLIGGAASVLGTCAFITPTKIPALGKTSQRLTFTPTDTSNYLTVTTTVTVEATATLANAPESLEAWRTRCFSPEQIAVGLAADDADPDGDGLVNVAEYALGTDPLVFTPPLTAVKSESGLVLTFTRPRGLPDVLYAAESSEDLIHWNPCPLIMIADGPLQTMQATAPLTLGNPARRFISLRVTRP